MCQLAARPSRAIAVVKGISFGHTRAQFCAKLHVSIPPGPTNTSNRSWASIFPVGFKLNNSTCPMAKAPM